MTIKYKMVMMKQIALLNCHKSNQKHTERISAIKCYRFNYMLASIDDVKVRWIPDHLCLIFSSFICFKPKVETIGQCLKKAALPRSVMASMLFALTVESNHMFASMLNTQLNGSVLNCSFSRFQNHMIKLFFSNKEWP